MEGSLESTRLGTMGKVGRRGGGVGKRRRKGERGKGEKCRQGKEGRGRERGEETRREGEGRGTGAGRVIITRKFLRSWSICQVTLSALLTLRIPREVPIT